MNVIDKTITDTTWDVVVVGGGMVGATVALGLGQQGMKVLLLERQAVDTAWSEERPYQVRVSALTRASEKILRNLGAWSGIASRRCHAFSAMHVWDDLSSGEIHFSAQEMGEPNLGYTVENEIIQAALWEQVEACDSIQLLLSPTIKTLRLEAGKAWLDVEGVGEIKTELLVGADGALSQIRQLAYIGLDTHDYEQCAVVGCVKTELPTEDTCWQRYTSEGP
ncbi:MAG TPA: FAD-dependent oxidoreductase, partial [Thiomicrorhabdus sp.]|nr:FAD-dependent oxidoreductase [Thiomicrorhabdus sp.]